MTTTTTIDRNLSERLADRIATLVPPNQITPTPLAGLSLYTWNRNERRMHLVFRPSLCVVARGEKVARLGDRSFSYDPKRYFFTAVPLPGELEVKRSRRGTLVGLVLELDPELVARVALEIEGAVVSDPSPHQVPEMMFTGELTPRLLIGLERLVDASTDDLRRQILQPGLMREILLELLTSPQGASLRKAVREQQSSRSLIDAILYMEKHAGEALSMPAIASRAGMSESGFYAKFRKATGTTPLRYLKQLRLTSARVRLIAGGETVTAVAYSVGYASSAQFSRDFRRAFGCPPSALKG